MSDVARDGGGQLPVTSSLWPPGENGSLFLLTRKCSPGRHFNVSFLESVPDDFWYLFLPFSLPEILIQVVYSFPGFSLEPEVDVRGF